ncbi:MAG: hypothetical protein HUJ51_02995 [Eggerthellaceae bacterium]|nr:hypothetical protein [Eggerthellaceae bacterium]
MIKLKLITVFVGGVQVFIKIFKQIVPKLFIFCFNVNLDCGITRNSIRGMLA